MNIHASSSWLMFDMLQAVQFLNRLKTRSNISSSFSYIHVYIHKTDSKRAGFMYCYSINPTMGFERSICFFAFRRRGSDRGALPFSKDSGLLQCGCNRSLRQCRL